MHYDIYLSDLKHIGLFLLIDVHHNERVDGIISTRDEGVVVPHVLHTSNPTRVKLAQTQNTDILTVL